ncbi:YHS domain-containing protein [bacterium]|nr:YHS domain-containing protein [bacterium]
MLRKRDPVCGAKINRDSKHFLEYSGKIYYFDCQGCKATFQEEPEKYIKKKSNVGFLKKLAKDTNSVPKCCHDIKN